MKVKSMSRSVWINKIQTTIPRSSLVFSRIPRAPYSQNRFCHKVSCLNPEMSSAKNDKFPKRHNLSNSIDYSSRDFKKLCTHKQRTEKFLDFSEFFSLLREKGINAYVMFPHLLFRKSKISQQICDPWISFEKLNRVLRIKFIKGCKFYVNSG